MFSESYDTELDRKLLVLTMEDQKKQEQYTINMLEKNNINGLLMFSNRVFNDELQYCYDITGKIPLLTQAKDKKFGKNEFKQMFQEILAILRITENYLLDPNDILLAPEYIYSSLDKSDIKFCYCPGYSFDWKKQLTALLEFFMNLIDYQEQDAVLILYGFYMRCRDVNCTLVELEAHIGKAIEDSIAEFAFDHTEINNRMEKEQSDRIKELEQHSMSEELKVKASESNYEFEGMQERHEIENEQQFYSKSCFIQAALVCFFLLLVSITIFRGGILKNGFGNGYSSWKVLVYLIIAVLLIILGSKIIFSPEKRHTKMCISVSYGNQDNEEPVKKEKGFVKRLILFFKNAKPSKVESEKQAVRFLFQKQELTGDKTENNALLAEQANFSEPFNPLLKPLNQESRIYNASQEEEKTVILFNSVLHRDDKEAKLKLIPLYKDDLPIIAVDSFPFFIGKLTKPFSEISSAQALSRYHARIVNENNKFYIYDLHSTNGTLLNGNAILEEEGGELNQDDLICFAGFTYCVKLY